MSKYSVEEVIQAWTAPMDERQAQGPEGYHESLRVTDLMLKLLAEGQPVSARRFALAAGLPEVEVQDFYTEY